MKIVSSLLLCSLLAFVFTVTSVESRLQGHRHDHFKSNLTQNKVKRFWINEHDLYDLTRLSLKESNYNITIPNTSDLFIYNIGANTNTMCRNISSQMYIERADNTCVILALSVDWFNEWSVLRQNNKTTGVSIKYNSGEECSNKISYQVTMELKCDTTIENPKLIYMDDISELSSQTCQKKIKGRSRSACKQVNYYVLWTFVNNFYYLFGTAFIVIGFFLNFFGKRFTNVTGFIAAYIVVITFILYCFVNVLTGEYIDWMWLVTFGCMIPAALIGWFMLKYELTFYLMIGGYCGFILAFLCYNFIFFSMFSFHSFIYWLMVIVYMIIFSIIAVKIKRHITIVLTSLTGGYSVLRGASLFVGSYPNEVAILNLLYQGESAQLSQMISYLFYVYLAGEIILITLGIVIQYKFMFIDEEEENNENPYRANENKLKALL